MPFQGGGATRPWVSPRPSYVVTHIGSHQGVGVEEGCRRVSEAIAAVLADAPEGASFLIENNPGSGTELAHTFEEYALIFAPLERYRSVLGVTLDTAHLWGAGYDISTAAGVNDTLAQFDRLVGLDRLKLIHANDTVYGLGSRNDEHLHPGQGKDRSGVLSGADAASRTGEHFLRARAAGPDRRGKPRAHLSFARHGAWPVTGNGRAGRCNGADSPSAVAQ